MDGCMDGLIGRWGDGEISYDDFLFQNPEGCYLGLLWLIKCYMHSFKVP